MRFPICDWLHDSIHDSIHVKLLSFRVFELFSCQVVNLLSDRVVECHRVIVFSRCGIDGLSRFSEMVTGK